MTTKYLNKLYDNKLVTREMTRKWTRRFASILVKLTNRTNDGRQ